MFHKYHLQANTSLKSTHQRCTPYSLHLVLWMAHMFCRFRQSIGSLYLFNTHQWCKSDHLNSSKNILDRLHISLKLWEFLSDWCRYPGCIQGWKNKSSLDKWYSAHHFDGSHLMKCHTHLGYKTCLPRRSKSTRGNLHKSQRPTKFTHLQCRYLRYRLSSSHQHGWTVHRCRKFHQPIKFRLINHMYQQCRLFGQYQHGWILHRFCKFHLFSKSSFDSRISQPSMTFDYH